MRHRRIPAAALTALLVAVASSAVAENPFSKILKGVKSTLQGTNLIIGTVEVQSPFPGLVTCFKDTPGAAISRRPIQSPAEAEGFPSLIMTRDGVVATGQCSELQAKGLLTGPATTAAGADTQAPLTNRVTIKDTELDNFFERHPQPGGGKHVDWPRVAITLVDAPVWGRDKQNRRQFKFPSFACWTYRARIWDSPEKSREIPAIHYCTDPPVTLHGGDSEMEYQVWSGIVGGSSAMNTRGSTGVNRTDGPNWPDTPLPVATRAGQAFVNPATFNGMMLYILMYDVGIDFRLEDHRVWLNIADSVPGAR